MNTTDSFLRWGTLTGLFFIPFVPLLVSSTLFFPFITPKNFTFRIVTLIVAGLWAILAVRNSDYRPKYSWMLVGFGALLVVMAIADFFGMNPYKSFWSNYERMEGYITFIHLFLYFLVLGAMLRHEKDWGWFFHTSLGAALFLSFYGLLQLSGELTINQGGVRLDATLGNATYLAAYLVFHIFLVLIYMFRGQKVSPRYISVSYLLGSGIFFLYYLIHISGANVSIGRIGGILMAVTGFSVPAMIYLLFQEGREILHRYIQPALYGIAFVLFLTILYFTATRGAILGLIGGLIISLGIIALFERERRFLRKIAMSGLVGIVVLVGIFFAVKDMNFVKQSPVLSRFSSLSLSETTTKSRFMIWNMALKGATESPKTFLIGYGQENFNFVFNKYYDPRMYADEQWFDRTHNIIFDWLIAGGILGLIAYLFLLASPSYYLWFRKPRPIDELKPEEERFSLIDRALFTGLFAAYFFQNIFVFDNITSYLMFVAFLAYFHHVYESSWSKDDMAPAKELDPELVNYMITPAVIIIVCGALYYFNVSAIQANRALISGLSPHSEGATKNLEILKGVIAYNSFGTSEAREQITQIAIQAKNTSGLDNATKEAFFNFAKDQLDAQVAYVPEDARYRLFYGSFLDQFGLFDLAAVQLKKALELSPRKQATFFELGTNYLTRGDTATALSYFKQAYELEPNYDEARKIYAIGAIYAHNDALVDQLLTAKYGSILLDDDRVFGAYVQTKQYSKAIGILRARMAKNPTDPNPHISLASVYYQSGDHASAIAEIRTAIKLDPNFKSQGESIIEQIQSGKAI